MKSSSSTPSRAHERSDLSHWCKRLSAKLELLLAESLRVAYESGALRTRDLARVKGRSSHKLLSEFGILRKRYWGQHIWGRGYWVATSGNVTDEVWMEYIKNQVPPEPDDNFKVT